MVALLKGLLCACLATMQVYAQSRPESKTKELIQNWFIGLDTSKVVYAVNCGSDS